MDDIIKTYEEGLRFYERFWGIGIQFNKFPPIH